MAKRKTTNLRHTTHFGLSLVQGVLRLVTAGAVLYELHELFLRYYAQEWADIQFNGPNRCAAVGSIANGDLIDGQTFCHDFINYAPWLRLYLNHPKETAIYYGAALVVFLIIGWAWQRRQYREEVDLRQDLEDQKAHGDARLATEAETIAAAKAGAGRRSSIHEQDF